MQKCSCWQRKGILVFSVSHLIIFLSPAYAIVMLGLLISGLGIGLFPANNSGWLASIAPAELRGKAVGGMTSALFLGQFFSPILTQPFVEQLGLTRMFGVAAVIAFLITVLFVIGAVRQRQASALVA
ncbi:MAG: MFS transporter [Chloroflexi bacterium]|nr:MFS transporter [Chloroflexota bacterium]